ncbi:MAG TPA: efflux RND transporter periplasmic adaptor subunit [Candidatus Paceibacterota bacterium]|nr:efflux RND transporter periplasmic adaptor subunit [Candidatus Paceibacterota bacterium]
MSFISKLKSYWTKIAAYARAHKVISSIMAVIVLGGAWWGWSAAHTANAQVRYVLGTVASSTIVSTVSASGQVSASNSVDIKPQVSGRITWVGVKAGQTVRAGQALASIDKSDAIQAIQDAENNLKTDKLNYQKSAAQAPIDYQNDGIALTNAKTDLENSYTDAYNDLTQVYLDLPTVMSGANDVLYGYEFDSIKKSQWNIDALMNIFNPQFDDVPTVQSFQFAAKADYAAANTSYTSATSAYKGFTRSSTSDQKDAMLAQSVSMLTAVAQALQSELNYLGSASDVAQKTNRSLPSNFATVQSTARTNLATANADLSKLLADKKTLDSNKQAITTAQQKITLDQVGNASDGSNPISLQVSANSIAKEEQDLAKMQSDLANYTIVAPFAGTLSAVDATVGDTAGSAAIATIISHSQVADLELNEVDAAKVKPGQKATLTFDAIEDLTLVGTVASVDAVGTVSQGVVSYKVEITFDTQDARIKPGMTVNAAIQTGVVQDALVVPTSAVKTQAGQSYVQVFATPITDTGGAVGIVSDTLPEMIPVVTGASDDTNIQIVSGLSEGQQIVTSTRGGTQTTSAATTRTTGAAGGNRGFGGGAAPALRGL